MFDKFKKKDAAPMSDNEKSAKMGVLHEIQKMASDHMGDKLKGLKKVTVASNSPEGLQEGLKKAEDVVQGPISDSQESEAHGGDESPEEEHMEDQSLSDHELDQKIQELLTLKHQRSQKM